MENPPILKRRYIFIHGWNFPFSILMVVFVVVRLVETYANFETPLHMLKFNGQVVLMEIKLKGEVRRFLWNNTIPSRWQIKHWEICMSQASTKNTRVTCGHPNLQNIFHMEIPTKSYSHPWWNRINSNTSLNQATSSHSKISARTFTYLRLFEKGIPGF